MGFFIFYVLGAAPDWCIIYTREVYTTMPEVALHSVNMLSCVIAWLHPLCNCSPGCSVTEHVCVAYCTGQRDVYITEAASWLHRLTASFRVHNWTTCFIAHSVADLVVMETDIKNCGCIVLLDTSFLKILLRSQMQWKKLSFLNLSLECKDIEVKALL